MHPRGLILDDCVTAQVLQLLEEGKVRAGDLAALYPHTFNTKRTPRQHRLPCGAPALTRTANDQLRYRTYAGYALIGDNERRRQQNEMPQA
jgi:hypothetical protein